MDAQISASPTALDDPLFNSKSNSNHVVVVPGEETDDTNETSDSDYLSFDESDAEETEAERKAREHERQLVLEAAGLIVKEDVKPPPRPPRPPRR